MTRATRQPRQGFSLLELLLVVVIVAAVSAVAAPRYARGLVRYRLDAAARRLATDLNYVRDTARHRSAPTSLVADAANLRYQLLGAKDAAGNADPVINLAARPYGVNSLTADFGGDGRVAFDGWGRPDSGGLVVLRIGAAERRVTLDAATGKAQVQ